MISKPPCGHPLRVEPRLSTGLMLFGLPAAAGLSLRRHPALVRLMAALSMVAGGFLAAELRTWDVAAPVLHAPLGPVTVAGRVAAVELLVKSARVTLTDVTVEGLKRVDTPAEVRIALTRYSDIPKLDSPSGQCHIQRHDGAGQPHP